MKIKFLTMLVALAAIVSCSKEEVNDMTNDVGKLNNFLKGGEYLPANKEDEIYDEIDKGSEKPEDEKDKKETKGADPLVVAQITENLTNNWGEIIGNPCDEGSVGVLAPLNFLGPESGCPSTYQTLIVTMDEEDQQDATHLYGSHISSGYFGLEYAGGVQVIIGEGNNWFDPNRDLRMTFCIVPYRGKNSACFGNNKDDYAVLQVADVGFENSYEVHVYHDNEDHNNANTVTLDGGSLYGGGIGNSHFDQNTQLSFHFFPSVNDSYQWPSYGFPYGVFGNFNDVTHVFCDDEDNNNYNQMWTWDYVTPGEYLSNETVGNCFELSNNITYHISHINP